MSGGGPTPASDGQWGFPIPAWRGYAPTQSQEYRLGAIDVTHQNKGATGHHGSDLMYRRAVDGIDSMWGSALINGLCHGTKNFFMPDSIPACAARDGTIWQCGTMGTGHFVVVDHGAPFATFYAHLSSVKFPNVNKGAGGIRVTKGQPLGIVGASPLDPSRMMHLHFEVWYKGGSESHIDPWPLLARAPLPQF